MLDMLMGWRPVSNAALRINMSLCVERRYSAASFWMEFKEIFALQRLIGRIKSNAAFVQQLS